MKGGINLSSELEMKNKYSTILNNKYRIEVIKQIQADLLNRYSNIIPKELDILSNNIFDFCCLMTHQISEDEILKYILYKNRCYYDTLSNEDKENLVETDLKLLKELSAKYIEVLKDNM